MTKAMSALAAFGFALVLVLTPAGEAQARPVAGGGVVVGHKELCRVNTNWFERYVMQMANTKLVLCRDI